MLSAPSSITWASDRETLPSVKALLEGSESMVHVLCISRYKPAYQAFALLTSVTSTLPLGTDNRSSGVTTYLTNFLVAWTSVHWRSYWDSAVICTHKNAGLVLSPRAMRPAVTICRGGTAQAVTSEATRDGGATSRQVLADPAATVHALLATRPPQPQRVAPQS